jgi:pyridinium-3,5-biscarboxylic acid mononucleotide sulfurtransferase
VPTVSVCLESDSRVSGPTGKPANKPDQPLDHLIPTANTKEAELRKLFRDLGSVIVAYSGGVDSSYIAYIANAELGSGAICVTGQSASLPQYLSGEISRVVERFGLRHEIIRTDELQNPGYQANNPDRCFFCKDELYTKLKEVACDREIATIVDGSTTDDLHDFRPGRQAASQHNVRSPLIEVGMSKAEVRLLSRAAELPTWDKPASPCLSSRIAYGTPVTIERLSKIDRGEEILRELGFREFRVRHHDTLVRLEIAPSEMDKVLKQEVVEELAHRFRSLGFKYVTLDLQGFRSGAMNEILPDAS